MRIVFVLAAGIIGGYALHSKKDQSIDSLATGAVDFITKNRKVVRDRFGK
jgi:hypothetical protein